MAKKTITHSEVDNTMLTLAQETQPTKKTITYKEVKKVALDVWNGGVQPTPPTPPTPTGGLLTRVFYEDIEKCKVLPISIKTYDFEFVTGDTIDSISYNGETKEFTIVDNRGLIASYEVINSKGSGSGAQMSFYVNDTLVDTIITSNVANSKKIAYVDLSEYENGSTIIFKSTVDNGYPCGSIIFAKDSSNSSKLSEFLKGHEFNESN